MNLVAFTVQVGMGIAGSVLCRIEKDGILEGLPPVDTNCQLLRREAVHVSDFT